MSNLSDKEKEILASAILKEVHQKEDTEEIGIEDVNEFIKQHEDVNSAEMLKSMDARDFFDWYDN